MSRIIVAVEDVFGWLSKVLENSEFDCHDMLFSESKSWQLKDGELAHNEKAFFSVKGFKYRYKDDEEYRYQPLILQSEIGILGFLVAEIDGEIHISFQAKIEPGNSGIIQLGPTLQATESNYKAKHHGKTPDFTSIFLNYDNRNIIVDQVQSEQGTRFYKKLNRNMVIKVEPDEIPDGELFAWVPLSTTLKLLLYENLINTDARSVLASFFLLNGARMFSPELLRHEMIGQIFSAPNEEHLKSVVFRMTKEKAGLNPVQEFVPLESLPGWKISDEKIYSERGAFYIKQIKVRCKTREVITWDQPIISTYKKGEIYLVVKKFHDTWKFLLQMRSEPAIFYKLELTSSVHVTDDNEAHLEFQNDLKQIIDQQKGGRVIYESTFSEEGGRFFQDENVYKVFILEDELDIPSSFLWVDASAMKHLILFNNTITNEARGIFSCLFAAGIFNK